MLFCSLLFSLTHFRKGQEENNRWSPILTPWGRASLASSPPTEPRTRVTAGRYTEWLLWNRLHGDSAGLRLGLVCDSRSCYWEPLEWHWQPTH